MDSLEQEMCTCAPAGLSPHPTSALVNVLLAALCVCVCVCVWCVSLGETAFICKFKHFLAIDVRVWHMYFVCV